jgi:hypothetical protein
MSLSFNTLRIGKKYRLVNYGDEKFFEVLEAYEGDNFRVKDLLTLEEFYLKDLILYGYGKDFELEEV